MFFLLLFFSFLFCFILRYNMWNKTHTAYITLQPQKSDAMPCDSLAVTQRWKMNSQKSPDCGGGPRITTRWAGFGPQARLSLHCGSSLSSAHTQNLHLCPWGHFLSNIAVEIPRKVWKYWQWTFSCLSSHYTCGGCVI